MSSTSEMLSKIAMIVEAPTATLSLTGYNNAASDVVCGQVQARMQTLKERLFDHVTEVLESNREPDLVEASKGWRKAWEKAKNFLKLSHGSSSNSQLQEKLQELHAEINSQIANEVRPFPYSFSFSQITL